MVPVSVTEPDSCSGMLASMSALDSDAFSDVSFRYRVLQWLMSRSASMRNLSQFYRHAF